MDQNRMVIIKTHKLKKNHNNYLTIIFYYIFDINYIRALLIKFNVMKTKLLFVGLLLGAASLTSCKKDFVCECKEDGQTYKYTLTESKKSAAAAVCEGEGIGGYEVNGEPVEMEESNCTLK